MHNSLVIINKVIVEVFNDILTIEETALKNGSFHDVSITEVHTVEAIGLHKKQPASEVSKKLNITASTLTAAIHNLVKKDYVARFSSELDRRVVMLGLTKKGRVLFRVHEKFHKDMIKQAVVGLSEMEEEVLVSALTNLHTFLVETYIAGQNS